jgi:hypothetical protein
MSDQPNENDRCPECTVLAVSPSLDALVLQLERVACQMDRLYEQRHFELQQKYGGQSFLDFQQEQRRPQPQHTHRPDERPPARDPSEANTHSD